MVSNTKVIFSKIPIGLPVVGEHLTVRKDEINLDKELAEDEFLIKTLYLSVDPYMRPRMRDASIDSYTPAFPLNEPMNGHAISVVLKSNNDKFKVDDLVYGMAYFSEYTHVPAAFASYFEVRNEFRESKFPLSYSVGVLGMPGMTAYTGLLNIGKPKAGETLYVSAASGAVGQLVGQIGKVLGLHVVGSAGSEDKVQCLKDIGFDGVFNYKTGDISSKLKGLCPKGIDIYFDNVGGEMLDIVLEQANTFGRIIACGMISQYNSLDTYQIKNILNVVSKRLVLQGMIVFDYESQTEEFRTTMTAWLKDGKVQYKETVAEGIENTPQALLDLFQGKNFGKQVVKVADL
ncbi:hypothetical protein BDF14DRAFT_1814368 [Spinellus fusiger]|nr:hypothetical protein BDF14DRAFT_1814363 [Spinellus fusiger]KAI7866356.1 hypothetical protein BDF14DRAFT_1814368 [Spinellus fusiger]